MKAIPVILMLAVSQALLAQSGTNRLTYERTLQMEIQLADDNPAFRNIPKERKDRFELLFSGNQSLWRIAEANNQSDEMSFGDEGSGMRIMMRVPGNDDVFYHQVNDRRRVDQRELGGKSFIVVDSIRRLNWKITGESRKILGYNCMQATTQRTQESFRVEMENGKRSRTRVVDTLNVVAWFTSEIPGSFGPDMYQGQLPGTILALDINNGRSSYVAVNIEKDLKNVEIKEPSKGKKLSAEEFAIEREKLFKEMEENNGGGRFIRRM